MKRLQDNFAVEQLLVGCVVVVGVFFIPMSATFVHYLRAQFCMLVVVQHTLQWYSFFLTEFFSI